MFSQTQANADTAAKVSRLMRETCQQKQHLVRLSGLSLYASRLADQPCLIFVVFVGQDKKKTQNKTVPPAGANPKSRQRTAARLLASTLAWVRHSGPGHKLSLRSFAGAL